MLSQMQRPGAISNPESGGIGRWKSQQSYRSGVELAARGMVTGRKGVMKAFIKRRVGFRGRGPTWHARARDDVRGEGWMQPRGCEVRATGCGTRVT